MTKCVMFFSAFLLCSCSTAASYHSDCFQQHNVFQEAVECTKQQLNSDFRVHLPVNHSFVATLYPYMDMVSEKVKTGVISESEGQFLIADKIQQLDSAQRDRAQKQQMINALTQPRPTPTYHTTCTGMGGMVDCTTY